MKEAVLFYTDSIDGLYSHRPKGAIAPKAFAVAQSYHLPVDGRSDGGGGLFFWRAAEPASNHNGGTIIAPKVGSGPGCWKRVDTSVWNVRWFGAKGDGTGDDAAAIQAAIDSAAL